jgi:hypothetical protein
MTADDWAELVKSMGPSAAGILFVVYILAKNGMLNVVLRDGSGSEEMGRIKTRLESLETRVAILDDRWERK